MTTERIPMTREGYEKLKTDLDRMQNAEMIEVAKRIAAATVLVLLSVAVLYLGWQTASTSSGETGGSDAAPPGRD